MRLIKYTHACVRLERDGSVLVIDPGIWSEPEALDGAHAVLVTHEHYDHIDIDRLRNAIAANPAIKVWTNADFANQLTDLADAVTAVAPGAEFNAAGFGVRVTGGRHAEVYGNVPDIANVGFLVDGVYHPGDSFAAPDGPVDTLLVPTGAPWLRLRESIDFVRAIAPRRAYSIHDATLHERGRQSADNWLSRFGETDYHRIDDGAPVEL